MICETVFFFAQNATIYLLFLNSIRIIIIFQIQPITSIGILSWDHLLSTSLHLVQMSLAYLLMLIVMTFNTWLCLAVVLGSTLGYFLVGWKKPSGIDVSDHCHWLEEPNEVAENTLRNRSSTRKRLFYIDELSFKRNLRSFCNLIQRKLRRWSSNVVRAVLYTIS